MLGAVARRWPRTCPFTSAALTLLLAQHLPFHWPSIYHFTVQALTISPAQHLPFHRPGTYPFTGPALTLSLVQHLPFHWHRSHPVSDQALNLSLAQHLPFHWPSSHPFTGQALTLSPWSLSKHSPFYCPITHHFTCPALTLSPAQLTIPLVQLSSFHWPSSHLVSNLWKLSPFHRTHLITSWTVFFTQICCHFRFLKKIKFYRLCYHCVYVAKWNQELTLKCRADNQASVGSKSNHREGKIKIVNS